MSEWIKCGERMPDAFVEVLITDGEHVEINWWDGSDWDSWVDRNSDMRTYDDVTHWMPLPPPPALV